MAIPEEQLETWSHQGSVTQSSNTYNTIRNALEADDSPYVARDFTVFLQGSYGNDTNIYSESDVDLVIQLLNSTFFHDLTELPQDEKAAFQKSYPDARYTYRQWTTDVLSQLGQEFGSDVKPGTKAVKIAPHGNRRSADVLIAMGFRRYHRFRSLDNELYDSGIAFLTSSGDLVANYPKQHSKNCTAKHQATNGWFKPMVRILKNMRSKLVDQGTIGSDLAPSYYLEGLLYNVPDENFGGTYENSFVNSLNWMLKVDRSKFRCANEQYYLLRDDPHVTWSAVKCEQFLNAVTGLWKKW